MRSILLGVCCVLVAAACTIAYLAMSSNHSLFEEGGAVKARVIESHASKKHGFVTVTYHDAAGAPQKGTVESASPEEARAVKRGDVVEILRHGNVPSRIVLRSTHDSSKPSWLLIVGIVVSLLLAGYLFVRPRLERARRAQRGGGLAVIHESVRRTRNGLLLVAGIVLPFGGFITYLVLATPERPSSTGGWIGVWAAVAFLVGLGGLMVFRALQHWDPRRSPIMRLLEEEPHRIAWMYTSVVTTNGIAASAAASIVLHLVDGKPVQIAVANDDVALLMEELAARAPGALIGYTPENQAACEAARAAAKEPHKAPVAG